MAKGKSKRKAGSLSQMERAIMTAYNYQGMRSQESYRDFMMNVKTNYKAILKDFDFDGKPSEPIPETRKNAKLLASLREKEDESNYLVAMRMMLLGYWIKNKRVYRMTQEAIDFIENRYSIDRLEVPMSALLNRVISEPIYIEFGNEKRGLSTFSGLFGFKNPNYSTSSYDDDWHLAFTFIVQDDASSIQVTRFKDDTTVAEYIRREYDFNNKEEQSMLCTRTLLYLGWLLMMRDVGEDVLRPKFLGPYTQYDILPIPYENSLPDFSKSGGWIAGGICNHFGYLSRENMVRDYRAALERSGLDREGPLAQLVGDQVRFHAERTEAFMKSIVLEWEDNKVVYQYDQDTGERLLEKYLETYRAEGIASDLIDFAPYPTMVLTNSDTGLLSVVSKCTVINPDGKIVPAFFFLSAWAGIRQCLIQRIGGPYEVLIISDSSNIRGEQEESIYALYHVLNVMKQKTIKRTAKELVQKEESKSEELVPSKAAHGDAVNIEHHNSQLIGSYAIEDVPLAIYDITARTVRLVPRAKAEERTGWKMRPHTRRAHPHRYWVGRGEKRHQVTRMLAPMQINRSQKEKMLTTVHELR